MLDVDSYPGFALSMLLNFKKVWLAILQYLLGVVYGMVTVM